MRSSVVKRSVIDCKRKTSISIEDGFWTAVKEIAASRGTAKRRRVAHRSDQYRAVNDRVRGLHRTRTFDAPFHILLPHWALGSSVVAFLFTALTIRREDRQSFRLRTSGFSPSGGFGDEGSRGIGRVFRLVA